MAAAAEGSDDHAELPLDPDAPDESAGARPLHLQWRVVVLVVAGGATGTAARYALEVLSPARPGQWPVGTFAANLVGAFALGVLLEFLGRAGADVGWRRRARLLAGTGFCGGLTTYSTFAVEADLLVRDGSGALAAGYVAASVLLGLLATALGIVAGARLHPRAGRS